MQMLTFNQSTENTIYHIDKTVTPARLMGPALYRSVWSARNAFLSLAAGRTLPVVNTNIPFVVFQDTTIAKDNFLPFFNVQI